MSKSAGLEVANISLVKPFSNTLDWDVVLYTSTNSQTVQIGCGVDSSMVSTLAVSASNIGVKTATPAHALDVNGWIRAYGSAAQNGIISTNTLNSGYSFYQCFGDFGSGLIMFQNGSTRATDGGAYTATIRNDMGDLRLMASTGTGIIVKSATGNVGIGTASPSTALQVSGTVNATTLQMGGNEVITVAGGKTITGNLTVAGVLSGNGSGISNLSGSAIGSGTVSASYLPTGDSNQKGILQLENSTNSSLTDRAATANAVRLAYARADTAITNANAALPKSGGTISGNLAIANDNNLQWLNNVGTAANILRVDSTNTTKLMTAGGDMFINADGGSAVTHIGYNTTGNIAMYNGFSAVLTKNGSRIGIGTTTPRAPLEVSGTAGSSIGYNSGYYFDNTTSLLTYFNGYYGAAYSIFVSNYYGGIGFTAISDKRIKKDIEQILPDMETLLRLRPVTYKYIDRIGQGTQTRYGFIAQEVEKLLPDLVYQSEDFVPDIYRIASFISDTNTIVWSKDDFGKFYDGDPIKPGDTLKLITKQNNENHVEVNIKSTSCENNMIHVVVEPNDKLTKELFIIGRKVSDFKNINYDDIMSWTVAQLQHIYKLHQTDLERIAILEDRIQETAKLEDRVQRLEQLLSSEMY